VTNSAEEGLMARKAYLERRIRTLNPLAREQLERYQQIVKTLDRAKGDLRAVDAMLAWPGPEDEQGDAA
jgi:hypothetical protein